MFCSSSLTIVLAISLPAYRHIKLLSNTVSKITTTANRSDNQSVSMLITLSGALCTLYTWQLVIGCNRDLAPSSESSGTNWIL